MRSYLFRLLAIECEECDEEFDGRRAFYAHVRQVHAEKKVFDGKGGDYKCDKPSNLESHMLIQSGERRVKCEQPFAICRIA